MHKIGIELELYFDSLIEFKKKLEDNNIKYIHELSLGNKHKLESCLKLIKETTLYCCCIKKLKDPIELNFPPMKDFVLLENVMNVVNSCLCLVNEKTALHIHFDMTEYDENTVKNLLNFYKNNENLIIDKVKKIQNVDETLLLSLNCKVSDREKYNIKGKKVMLNIFPYYSNYHTVEHRIFMATLNIKEIEKCAMFTSDLLEYGIKNCNKIFKNEDDMIYSIGYIE